MEDEVVDVRTNPLRVGNFTSSDIVALTAPGTRKMTDAELAARPKSGDGSRKTLTEDPDVIGDAAYTYIDECNHERRLGRSLDKQVNARPLSWGKIAEKKGFEHLDTSYRLVSDATIVHPEFDCWSGTPDVIGTIIIVTERIEAENVYASLVGDIKSPETLKSFITLVTPLYHGLTGIDAMNAIRFGFKDNDGKEHDKHKDGNKFYWQLVSNAILADCEYAELAIYCPYKSELEDIRQMVAAMDDLQEQRQYYWIYMASDDELPWIPDGGYYKNMNTIRFRVPEEDKKFLTNRVRNCKHLLIPRS
jgi:hypothetical protein